jgi:DNA-binding FadR family transcriptional regulator
MRAWTKKVLTKSVQTVMIESTDSQLDQASRIVSITAPNRNLINDLMDFMRTEGFGRGDRLPPIRQLSATLGFGRNAIRDGLLEAQTMGFVKIEPRLGVFVQNLDAVSHADGMASTLEKVLTQQEQNFFHLVDARRLVEVELAGEAARTRRPEELLPLRQALETVLASHEDRLAFVKADEAFHLAIARLAGNRVLLAFLQTLWRMIQPAKMNLLLSPESRDCSDREHQELFQSIVGEDVDKARAIMRAHIGKGRALLLDYVRTLPDAESEPGEKTATDHQPGEEPEEKHHERGTSADQNEKTVQRA